MLQCWCDSSFIHIIKLRGIQMIMGLHGKITFISSFAHLSQRLKWAFLIKNLSVVRRCRRCSTHLHLLLQKHMTKFNQNLHKASLNPLWKGITVYSKDGRNRFPRGDNNKLKKIHWKTFKMSPEPLAKFQPNQAQSIIM